MVTGMNGTVAPVVAERLIQSGHTVVGWDRSQVPIDERAAIRSFLDRERPAYFFHVATGPAAWAEAIGDECAERGIGLVYTSSVSVFSDRRRGPLCPDATPDATDEYGRYKAECEARIRERCPQAIIARLGWQIGSEPGSNNMVDYLHRTVGADGRLEISRRWYPACSFLADTAESLCTQFRGLQPGVYHLDGNPGLSLYEIAGQLKRLHGWDWSIVPIDEPSCNNLMQDERLTVRPITEHFVCAET
jgi:dTDP-4-dehydrorhamnose reductase